MARWLVGSIVALLVVAGAVYFLAGRGAPPQLTIVRPDRLVGQSGSIDVTAQAPNARFTSLTIAVEQNNRTIPLFSLDRDQSATVTQTERDRVRISRPLGKQSVPDLQQGTARLIVTATRPSFLNLRTLSSTATKDFQVRLEPPRISVVSTHHYVNHGGSEMVVYRATPADVTSGVRVGDIEYPGYPAAGAGVADPAVKMAFFALLHDQELTTPIAAFARDEAGNEATVRFVDDVFAKSMRRSKVEIDDKFMNRVVPEILEHSPELKIGSASGDQLLPAFLKVNGELRRINADQIAAFSRQSASAKLWDSPFVQLGNSKVEASFADHRTYFHNGKEIDQQVHLGFDLAVTARVPIVAANAGTVFHAGWLGIYGNSVVIDHGMGVQSLYGHLSSLDVTVGDRLMRGQPLGRSGMTGMAGGDHLHFTMLVGGRMVNPVEWWDPHWIQDRVERKLKDAAPASGR